MGNITRVQQALYRERFSRILTTATFEINGYPFNWKYLENIDDMIVMCTDIA